MKQDSMTPVIGIEMHVELATVSKMFCGCPAYHFGVEPNTQTCPVCLGMPGALPVPNKKAIDWTIMIGLALDCKIANESKFDRKHYFYPDLAKGYQISQYDLPLCFQGKVETDFGTVNITRAHLEEDTGKLQHRTIGDRKVSLVDYNRGGVPLVEIVTEPDIKSSAQAKDYAKNVARIIRFLGVSDADMEKGSMRLEANISWGLDLGYKVEVKNINSFNYLAKAIDYELARQKQILASGKVPIQETRGYNETKGITFSQRTKEDAADYRYFPDPDIPPMVFTDSDIESIRASMPELPNQIHERWSQQYNLNDQYYSVLLADRQIAQFAQASFDLAEENDIEVNKIASEIVNSKIDIAKTKPEDIVAKLKQKANKITDTSQLDNWAQTVIEANPKAVTDYKDGKEASLQYLMGQVMKVSKGQASAAEVVKLLKAKLS